MCYINIQNKLPENIVPLKHITNSLYDISKNKTFHLLLPINVEPCAHNLYQSHQSRFICQMSRPNIRNGK